jgi:hypothetical protein
MTAKTKTIPSDDPWEDRLVGADEQFVEVASEITLEVSAALELHPISIRFQKNLVDNLKALAQLHGLGYQPLVRQILTRWVDAELKHLIVQRANERTQALDEVARTKLVAGSPLHKKVA